MDEFDKKRLPIGIESFEEIRTDEYYYVDKTAFIRDLLRRRGKVNLFTRPRRFGKTLNMDMLKSFFQIGGDRALFDGLDIAGETGLCERYMGKFPVISVSLKGVNGLDYDMARALMCLTVGREAMKFYGLLDSDRLTDDDKKVYRQLINVDSTGQGVYDMSDATLMGSLNTLSALLEKHYGSKAVILIDEYDVPLAKANEQGYYDRMIVLIRNMFEQALKTNSSLQFAVLTGCLRVSKESIFTGLNNMKVFSVTDEDCGAYFGFTDAEVREMLAYYDLSDKYETIRDWYDGYRFGDVDVYCPWDVIYYVDKLQAQRTLQPQNYWANTSSNEVLKRLLENASSETRDEIERLIAGESVWKQVSEELTYKELYDSTENVWSVLFATGYLTQQGEPDGKLRRLVIPNREIHDIFMTQIRDWMQEKAREDRERLRAFCEAFRDADGEKVQRIFGEYLHETVSIRDTAVRKELKENFYHGFLLGLLRFKEDWKVLSNRESGQGYADIVIEIYAEKTGIVIEVKYAENGDLDAGCREAMEQIGRKDYADRLGLGGMSRVIKCGIACHVKNCKVVFEKN
ncbi:MAG: ATP-binding protein [Acetatifactor sp.]